MPRLVLNRPMVVVMRESSRGVFCAVLSGLEGAEQGAWRYSGLWLREGQRCVYRVHTLKPGDRSRNLSNGGTGSDSKLVDPDFLAVERGTHEQFCNSRR